MTANVPERAFALDPAEDQWPPLDPKLVGDWRPEAPAFPLEETFGPCWAKWIRAAAEAKSAPVDYVAAALLTVAGAAIGNARWAAPWHGWAEPPILWAMAIGSPSAGKSPALDAVLGPLRAVEREMQRDVTHELATWRDEAELARMAETTWKEAAKAALKAGETPPEKPKDTQVGEEPWPPRLSVADGTVERLAVICAKQPKGTLMARDELAGWLQGMTRYAGGGSDRPFWLEAYGGRAYTVERMGRDPVHVDRLAIGVLGSIQPDRLKSLLLKADDDGLLARFLPVWPDPVPLKRPNSALDEDMMERAIAKLHALHLRPDESGGARPWLIPFSDGARDRLDVLRQNARKWEDGSEGLLLSFTGKLPGLTVRLALVLSYLDWTLTRDVEPVEIDADTFARAAGLVERYALPMARRAYAEMSLSPAEDGARRLLAAIRQREWTRFTLRHAQRLELAELKTASRVREALQLLAQGGAIKAAPVAIGPRGGRPADAFEVRPDLG